MQTLQRRSNIVIRGHDEEIILRAYQEAIVAGQNYAQKALICGQLLCEKRDAMTWTSHDEKSSVPSSIHGRNQHSKGSGFLDWLNQLFPEKGLSTLYRWMAAADRTVKVLDLENIIDVQSERISAALILPEDELSDAGREARQMFFEFTSDKTIADCLRDVADGSSPDHRIARAANGKKKGGTRGENRKDWPSFIRDNLKSLTSHVSHWGAFTGTQIASTDDHFKRAIAKWPDALLETLKEEITEELKRR